jgi:hypothetical protein
VDCTNNFLNRIMEEDCLTVSLLNQETDSRLAGDQGICAAEFSVFSDIVGNCYLLAMNLDSRYKVLYCKAVPELLPVLLNSLWQISHPVTQVQALIRGSTKPAMTAEHAMADFEM